MKLVELLAKKVSEWHDDTAYVFQDLSGTIYCTSKGKPKYKASWQEWNVSPSLIVMSANDPLYGVTLGVTSDHAESVVDRAQWQAERDRQKGGEWKRHRGNGKQPKGLKHVSFEVKHRDGNIWPVKSIGDSCWRWTHDGSNDDIMAYRIISQPQAEEVEVKDTTEMRVFDSAEALYAALNPTQEVKWEQSSGPLAWRDTIIHCQAIIEDCEREIQRNVDLLDAEGLAMQIDNKKAMQHYAQSIATYDWKVGDILEIVANIGDHSHEFKIGEQVKIAAFDQGDDELPIRCDALDGSDFWYIKHAEAKFISRP